MNGDALLNIKDFFVVVLLLIVCPSRFSYFNSFRTSQCTPAHFHFFATGWLSFFLNTWSQHMIPSQTKESAQSLLVYKSADLKSFIVGMSSWLLDDEFRNQLSVFGESFDGTLFIYMWLAIRRRSMWYSALALDPVEWIRRLPYFQYLSYSMISPLLWHYRRKSTNQAGGNI